MTRTENQLSAPKLAQHLETFLGFGSPAASVWFIGPEQGGGHDLAEIERRLNAWETLGEGALVDLHEYHRLIGIDRWFNPKPKIQSTWGKLIRAYLALTGKSVDTEAVRSFQAGEFGDRDGDIAIVELMPLPSRSMSHWIFDAVAGIPYLKTRELYVQTLLPKRIEVVRAAIAAARPSAVVCYGAGYIEHWETIAGRRIPRDDQGFGMISSGPTHYAVTPHPIAHGVTNAQFVRLGEAFATRRAEGGSPAEDHAE